MYIWRAFPPPPACYFLGMEDTTTQPPQMYGDATLCNTISQIDRIWPPPRQTHLSECITMQPDATRFPTCEDAAPACVPPGRTQTRLRNEPNLTLCFQQKLKTKAKFRPDTPSALYSKCQTGRRLTDLGTEGRNRNRKRVIEDGARLRKSDTVLPEVRRILSPVPLKSDSNHLPSSLANREPLRRARPIRMTGQEACPTG